MQQTIPKGYNAVKMAIVHNAGKKSMKEIAVIANVVPSTISKYATHMKISLALESKIEKKKNALAFIAQKHDTMTAQEIADYLNIPRHTIYLYGGDLGITFKPDGRMVRNVITKIDKNAFNVHAHDNWIF